MDVGSTVHARVHHASPHQAEHSPVPVHLLDGHPTPPSREKQKWSNCLLSSTQTQDPDLNAGGCHRISSGGLPQLAPYAGFLAFRKPLPLQRNAVTSSLRMQVRVRAAAELTPSPLFDVRRLH